MAYFQGETLTLTVVKDTWSFLFINSCIKKKILPTTQFYFFLSENVKSRKIRIFAKKIVKIRQMEGRFAVLTRM